MTEMILAASMVKMIGLSVPVNAPVHPENLIPTSGTAASVTLVWFRKSKKQFDPQLIPPGADMTIPVPKPVLVTINLKIGSNLAKMNFAESMVTVRGLSIPV